MLFFFFFLARHAKGVRGVVLIQQLSMCQEIRRKVRHVTKEKRLFFFSSFSNVQCNFVLDYRGLLCVFFCVCFFSLLRYNPWQTNGEKKIRTGDCLFSAKRVRV